MATLGSLVINVSANTKDFQAGLDRARTQIKGFAGDIPALLQSAGGGGLAKALGGGLMEGLKDLPYGIGMAMTAIDSLAQGYRHAKDEAEAFGLTISQFASLKGAAGPDADKLSMGLGKLQKMLTDAVEGSGEARDKFDSLGLSWKDLASVQLDDAAQKVGQRFNEAASFGEKAAISFGIFKKGGLEMIDVFEKVGDKLDMVRKKQEALAFEEAGKMANDFTKMIKDLPSDALVMLTRAANATAGFLSGGPTPLEVQASRAEAARRAAEQANRQYIEMRRQEEAAGIIQGQTDKVGKLGRSPLELEREAKTLALLKASGTSKEFALLNRQFELEDRKLARIAQEKEAVDRLRGLEAEIQQPLDMFRNRMADLQQMAAAGPEAIGGINRDQMALAALAAFRRLPQAQLEQMRNVAPVIDMTTAAGISAARKLMGPEGEFDPLKQIAELEKEQVEELKAAHALLEKIAGFGVGFQIKKANLN